MFKKSIYNIIINPNNNDDYEKKFIIYNTYSSALAILNNELKKIYDNIEKVNNKSENEQFLFENGFIVDENINEYKKLCSDERLNRYNSKILNLTIAPTLSCNMNCIYCYEDNLNIKMNNEVINAILIFIDEKIKKDNIEKINILWYGGEPLLQVDTIKFLSEKIIELTNKYSIDYSSSIVTNGVLINENFRDFFRECKIKNIQITLDGLSNIHNKRRPLKNGLDSFEIIIKNIEYISKYINVIIRVNIDKENYKEISKLLDFFINKNLIEKIKFYFYPVVKKNTSACKVSSNNCLSTNEFKKIEKELLYKLYNTNNINSIHNLYPRRSPNFCTAICNNSFVIDPEGYLYTCWDYIGIKEKSIGTIFNKLNINNEYSKWLLLDTPIECSECKLVPLCKGGCPASRIATKNKYCCDPKLVNIEEKLKLIYYNYNSKNKRTNEDVQ